MTEVAHLNRTPETVSPRPPLAPSTQTAHLSVSGVAIDALKEGVTSRGIRNRDNDHLRMPLNVVVDPSPTLRGQEAETDV